MTASDSLRQEIVKRLDHVCDELHELNVDRHIWQSTARIAESNPVVAGHSFFPAWIGTQYYRRALTAIRAMVDPGMRNRADETDSLVTVLGQVADNTSRISVFNFAPELFTDEGVLDADAVREDIKHLTDTVKVATKYVNKYIAHLDRNPQAPMPSGKDVDDAIDLIGEIAHRYYLVLTGIDYDLTPRILFDWSASLTVAWRQS